MRWYDVFSLFYDRSLEQTYRAYRVQAVERLRLAPGATVLDLACGTGQNFPALVEAVSPTGQVLGVDLSRGMLARARQRIARAGWKNVHLLEQDAQTLAEADLAEFTGGRPLDGALCTLGLTVIPDWRPVFEATFALLRSGGRYALLDVHAPERSFQTRMVELFARADVGRKVWEPLEALASDFTLEETDAPAKTVGGTLFVASGTRPPA
ncbi:MAG: methyltransferase domain-containing protein [Deltaproteobacteria bacterium]|nr:methyltransferase domain-containing protein [Deltaproteobacteria bacterium]